MISVSSGQRPKGGAAMSDQASISAELLEGMQHRLRRIEDERAIERVVIGYGPAADPGLADRAGSFWADDGLYDWDATGQPHRGRESVSQMLRGDHHQGLI